MDYKIWEKTVKTETFLLDDSANYLYGYIIQKETCNSFIFLVCICNIFLFLFWNTLNMEKKCANSVTIKCDVKISSCCLLYYFLYQHFFPCMIQKHLSVTLVFDRPRYVIYWSKLGFLPVVLNSSLWDG